MMKNSVVVSTMIRKPTSFCVRVYVRVAVTLPFMVQYIAINMDHYNSYNQRKLLENNNGYPNINPD